MTEDGSLDRHLRMRAILAFLMIFWLSLVITTVILVGALSLEPRAAALLSTIPATLLGVCGAAYQPTRNLFSAIWVV